MAVDIFDTRVLNRVIDNKVDKTTFLVDKFFPSVQVSEEETIMFDTTGDRKYITPFVSPVMEGKLVAELGYNTQSFRPAYLKDKRVFDPNKQFRRRPGEAIGGSLTAAARLQASVSANMDEQLEMMAGRFEVMAGEALRLGQVTISGERYPTKVVSFGRRSANRVVKTSTARWTADGSATVQSGVSPVTDIEYEAQELSDATGVMPTDVIFGPKAWALFEKDLIANYKDSLDKNLSNSGLTEIDMSYVNQPRDGVVYRGRRGYLKFWTYTGTYTNPEDGQTITVLGDYEVLIGNGSVDGVRHFGAIRDLDALQARQYFVKSWTVPDPSARYLLMQSAPLLVPYRPDRIKSIKVY